MGGAFVLQTILTILFMPESAYHRTGAINIDTGDRAVVTEEQEKTGYEHNERSSASPRADSNSEAPVSWTRELLPWNGYFDHTSFWRTLLHPFLLLASPMILWATLLFTTCISWLVLISITLSQIFSAPPYNFSVSAVGASNLSSFVATLIATGIAGPVIDGVVKLMSKVNKGVFGT